MTTNKKKQEVDGNMSEERSLPSVIKEKSVTKNCMYSYIHKSIIMGH